MFNSASQSQLDDVDHVSAKVYDPVKIRSDFPLLKNLNDLNSDQAFAYLDNAASSQKPNIVIKRINDYYLNEHANIHRGIYTLSEEATQNYENARASIAKFIGCDNTQEIIVTRGCTEAINLVASSWGGDNINSDSEIILTVAEHHANIVPWQILAKKTGAKIIFIDLNANGTIDLQQLESALNSNTALVSIFHVSNVLGTQNDIAAIASLVKQKSDACLMIDAAQSIPHISINVKDLDIDFLAFSGHKMCGPTGIGILWAKKDILEKMSPYHGGGDMIDAVTTEGFSMTELPHRFEAGTPSIAAMLGLEQAAKYLSTISLSQALAHDVELGCYLVKKLKQFEHVKTFAFFENVDDVFTKEGFCQWIGVVSFYHEKIHAHDLAFFCDNESVALRAGHHCAMPLHKYLKAKATLRAAPYIYNTKQDIDQLVSALVKAENTFLS